MDRSPAENPTDPTAELEAAQEKLRVEQTAWLQEQTEWEDVRRQVEAGLADLEGRLLEQAKRLRCPRGSEEFEAALNEQLRLAVDRQAAIEERLAESERRREVLVEQLKEEGHADPGGELAAEVERLREQLREQLRETQDATQANQQTQQTQLARIEELEQAAAAAQASLDAADAEIAGLRSERDEAARQRDEAQADLAALSVVSAELDELRQSHEQLRGELHGEREQKAALDGEAEGLREELGKLRDEATANEGLRQSLDAAEERTAEEQAKSSELAARVAELEGAAAELAALKKEQKNSLLSQRDRLQVLESELSAWDDNHAEFEERIDELQRENDDLTARLAEAEAAVEAAAQNGAVQLDQAAALVAAEAHLKEVQRELDQRAAASATDAAELERLRQERSELFRELDHNQARVEDVAAAQAETRALLEEKTRSEADLQDALTRVESLEAELAAHATTETADLEALRVERDSLAQQLELAAAQLAEATRLDAELQGKFDLALTDLQANREQVATLETELSTRPEASDQADPEQEERLRQVTEERDALLRQIEEAAPTEEPSQELADLRQRFEMAVEDLRELKTENQELADRLAQQPAATAGSDGNGWEAQKQRLLAALQDEGDTDNAERQAERVSIAGTIQITDELIAEKDREIERLRSEVERVSSIDEAEAATTLDATLNTDAMILHERERLAKLEEELSGKLRAAELELSVERAKISRAQSEIEEQQLELETLRAAQGLAKDAADGTAPKRRWLDKLGLGGEGQ